MTISVYQFGKIAVVAAAAVAVAVGMLRRQATSHVIRQDGGSNNNKLNSQFCGWYLEPRAKCQDQLSIAGLVTGSIWLPKNMSDQIDLATLDQQLQKWDENNNTACESLLSRRYLTSSLVLQMEGTEMLTQGDSLISYESTMLQENSDFT